MGKIHTSYETVSRAYHKVRMELWDLRVLWDGSKLDQVSCTYDSFALIPPVVGIMGLYYPAAKAIKVPAWYLPIMALFMELSPKNAAIDVLRHEFAHALADLYPRALSDGGLFKKAFGGAYGTNPAKGTDPDDWEDRCVSGYAATATQEDFAETFMLYMKHKGKVPTKFAKKPAIRKKWKAVAKIIRRVAASPR